MLQATKYKQIIYSPERSPKGLISSFGDDQICESHLKTSVVSIAVQTKVKSNRQLRKFVMHVCSHETTDDLTESLFGLGVYFICDLSNPNDIKRLFHSSKKSSQSGLTLD